MDVRRWLWVWAVDCSAGAIFVVDKRGEPCPASSRVVELFSSDTAVQEGFRVLHRSVLGSECERTMWLVGLVPRAVGALHATRLW
jgi:hypothetical protein